MDNVRKNICKYGDGLEALAGDVPLLPAKASSPALFIIHYPLSIIHYPLSIIH
jgi:hypothetical protein